ncbi:formate dehydrogenase [Dendryphion nanum]|uniref:Formate dehydrogenase n=1 Tax=Dendryphion nanum TaxID=256645 RepID=A0A9P9INI2_9PLEO|nr:formate dehydrogenase [Dendryphion nanum]
MVFLRSFHRLARPASSVLSARAAPRVAPRATFLRQPNAYRTLTATASQQGKVLLVLYDGGKHAEDEPQLLGTTENELGIRKWLEDQGHELVTTSDKEGENSEFDKHLVDAEVIITTPFHPGYLTAERLAKAKNLKLAVTAGIGSDHVDLNAANKTNGGVTVAEVTGSNVVSVAEHVVMTILVLVRNFVPAHEQIAAGDWNVAAVAKNEYDLENKVVGTVAVGRIGERVLRRLRAFDCKELLYFDYQPLSPEVEKEIGCRRVENLEEMLAQCDVVTINCPLHEKTRGLFNKELISKMKKGTHASDISCSPHNHNLSQRLTLSSQAHGSSTRPAAPLSSKKTSLKPSSQVNSAAMAVTSGSRSRRPRTILSAMLRTHGEAAMPWYRICRVLRSMLRRYVFPLLPYLNYVPILTPSPAIRRRHQGNPRLVLLRTRRLQARRSYRAQG